MNTVTTDNLYDMEVIQEARVAPDGRMVVYTVQRVERSSEKKYSNLWLAAVDGGAPRRLTYGDWRDSQPRWLPDGSGLIFLSNRHDEQSPRLYLLSFGGGEARPLPQIDERVLQFKVSPDGARLALLARPKDADQLAREQDEQKKKLGVVAHHITRVRYKADGIGYLPQSRVHLYLYQIESGDLQQLTTGDFDVGSFAWSPDSKTICFSANLDEEADFKPAAVQLYSIAAQVENGEPYGADQLQQITDHPGSVSLPVFSPDGTEIAFLGQALADGWWQNLDLFVVAAAGGAARNLSAHADTYMGSNTLNDVTGTMPTAAPQWSADGKRIFMQATRHGVQPLVAVDRETGAIERIIDDAVIGAFGVAPDQQSLIYYKGTLTDPGQLFHCDRQSGEERQLTAVNAWLQQAALGAIEEVWFTAGDGYQVQGWILTPPDFDENVQYPTIIEIHGGPQTQYGRFFMHEFYYLAAAGYVVAFCNPRGGQGYGGEHARAIHGKWGSVDYSDVMDWSDYVERLPYVDSARMGVTGGSYGGVMTAWIIGRSQRFKAAVVQRLVFNWTSMLGTADFNWGWTLLTGDPYPWQDYETNWRHSPFSDIHNAKTPTLVIHSMNDMRTSFEQGEQLFVVLKTLGVESELVAFPEESHGLSRGGRTDRRVARLQHIRRWFDRYLQPDSEQG